MWETEGANTLLVSSEIALYETNSSTMSKQIGAAARCQAKSEKNPASHLHCCKGRELVAVSALGHPSTKIFHRTKPWTFH